MTRNDFEKIVLEAVRTLPRKFRDRLQNIDIVIETGTGKGESMGLYEGVPLGERGEAYSGALPDKITLFKKEIEAECEENGLDVKKEVRQAILHEIAHHFGISDERLEDLGTY